LLEYLQHTDAEVKEVLNYFTNPSAQVSSNKEEISLAASEQQMLLRVPDKEEFKLPQR